MAANVRLLVQVTALYVITYLLSGGLAYQLLTHRFYVGDDPVFASYLRSEANPAEWAHVTAWMLPGLVLRAAMICAVLFPLLGVFQAARRWKRVGYLFAMMFVLTHMAAAAPSPSNLEGLIYMKPAFIGVLPFLVTLPEMILQCLLFAGGTSWLAGRQPRRTASPSH